MYIYIYKHIVSHLFLCPNHFSLIVCHCLLSDLYINPVHEVIHDVHKVHMMKARNCCHLSINLQMNMKFIFKTLEMQALTLQKIR